MKQYTIPFFIIHKGCPHQCIFCDQKKITGKEEVRAPDVSERIEKYLDTMPPGEKRVEVGFFGGSFTGLSIEHQEALLYPVQKFIDNGRIQGIRMSTRPDLITEENLDILKSSGVKCIELGVQSMNDNVLSVSKRGHTAQDTEKASKMIIEKGFILGHQIMVGLPESSFRDEYYTANKVKELGASQVRIYPVLVMKDTSLVDLWSKKQYEPLGDEEAIERCAKLVLFFNINSIDVIRCGLHPSEGLLDGTSYLAGPFHSAFGEKTISRMFTFLLEYVDKEYGAKGLTKVGYNPKDRGAFYGFEKSNMDILEKISGGREGFFISDEKVPRKDLLLYFGDKVETLDKGLVRFT